MTGHRRPGRYPVEFRERAVRMVFEAERHCGSQWEAITQGGRQVGSDARDGAQVGAAFRGRPWSPGRGED